MKKLILVIAIVFLAADINASIFYKDSVSAYSQVERIINKMSLNDIIVKVEYVKSAQLLKGNDVFGYTYEKDDVYYICIKRGLDYDEIKTVITHEMIHIWQMNSGKLKTYKNGWVWNGKFYPISTTYAKRIHEKDAKILERNRFFN